MVNYERFKSLAKRLIEANGRTVTFVFKQLAPADVEEPWRGPDPSVADTEFTAIAVFSGGDSRAYDETGTMYRIREKFFLVAHSSLPTGTVLEECDIVRDGTVSYNVKNVERIHPGSTEIFYRVLLDA